MSKIIATYTYPAWPVDHRTSANVGKTIKHHFEDDLDQSRQEDGEDGSEQDLLMELHSELPSLGTQHVFPSWEEQHTPCRDHGGEDWRRAWSRRRADATHLHRHGGAGDVAPTAMSALGGASGKSGRRTCARASAASRTPNRHT